MNELQWLKTTCTNIKNIGMKEIRPREYILMIPFICSSNPDKIIIRFIDVCFSCKILRESELTYFHKSQDRDYLWGKNREEAQWKLLGSKDVLFLRFYLAT